MKRANKASAASRLDGANTIAINKLQDQVTTLTAEVERLRQRLDGSERECSALRGYHSTTEPIMGDLAHNPFASIERLRLRARKALRRPYADA